MTRRLFGTGLLLAASLLTFGCGGSKTGDAPAAPPRGPAPAAPAAALPAAEPEISPQSPEKPAAPAAAPEISPQLPEKPPAPPAAVESKEPAGGTSPGQSKVLGAIGRAVRGAIGKPAEETPAEAPKYNPPK